MNTPAHQFKQWMVDLKLRASDVSQRFGVSVQTIGHWRSQGVPKTKIPHVNYVISCWEKPTAASLGQTLLLTPTVQQFRHWNEIANAEDQLIEDWAIHCLDKYAAEIEVSHPHLSMVAEPELPYPNPHPNGKNSLGNG